MTTEKRKIVVVGEDKDIIKLLETLITKYKLAELNRYEESYDYVMLEISLMNDIQNFKPFDNPEHIHIIGDQAIELQKSKIIFELNEPHQVLY